MVYEVLIVITLSLFIFNFKKINQVGISDVFYEVFGISFILIYNDFNKSLWNNDLLINIILLISALLTIELLFSNKYMSIKSLLKSKKRKRVTKSEKAVLITLILITDFALGALLHNSGMGYNQYLIFIGSFIAYINIVKLFPYFFLPIK